MSDAPSCAGLIFIIFSTSASLEWYRVTVSSTRYAQVSRVPISAISLWEEPCDSGTECFLHCS
jgi:hypothetical protein